MSNLIGININIMELKRHMLIGSFVATSEACAVGPSVFARPHLIFPSKTWFFGIYLNFQWQKSL
jgi:hypothetical protein